MTQPSQIDHLNLYYSQISKFPLLTRKEEMELLLKVRQGDSKAASDLAKSNTRFVVKMAHRYINSGVPILDLISEGNIGLIKAIEFFDANRIGKIRLITYASWWIKQKIHMCLHDSCRNVKTSYGLDMSLHKLYKLGIVPRESVGGKPFLDPEDIRKAIGSKTEDQVVELNRLYFGDLYFQSIVGEEGGVADTLSDQTELQDISYEDSEIKVKIKKYLEVLTEKEKSILIEYFGLGEDRTPKTLLDLGQSMNISRERIRQIKKIALNKLRFSPDFKELLNFL